MVDSADGNLNVSDGIVREGSLLCGNVPKVVTSETGEKDRSVRREGARNKLDSSGQGSRGDAGFAGIDSKI